MPSKDKRTPSVRRGRAAAAAARAKPYMRDGAVDSTEDESLSSAGSPIDAPCQQLPSPSDSSAHSDDSPYIQRFTGAPLDIMGFPSYDEYKRLEASYINSLSDRKQHKALITQAMFEQIWDVLHDPECLAGSAQFRFWVRKMFVLRFPQTSLKSPASADALTPVVLHDNRPVAIKEQLYEVLCYCHALARHGGRDKTCAAIRAHYSWVPKELTAKFVKACPTCTLKRSGNPELFKRVNDQISVPRPLVSMSSAVRPADEEAPYAAYSPYGPGPSDPAFLRLRREPRHNASFSEGTLSQSEFPGRHYDAQHYPTLLSGSYGYSGFDSDTTRGTAPLMQRSVRLYDGLPMAWQFPAHDSEIRHAHMMAMDGDPRFLDSPDSSNSSAENSGSQHAHDGPPRGSPVYMHHLLSADDLLASRSAKDITLPPLMHALSDSGAGRDVGIMRHHASHVFPHAGAQRQSEPQIDPALLMDVPVHAERTEDDDAEAGTRFSQPASPTCDAPFDGPLPAFGIQQPSPRAPFRRPLAPTPLDLSLTSSLLAPTAYRSHADPTASTSPTSAGTNFSFSSALTLSGAPSPLTPAFSDRAEDALLAHRAGGLHLGVGGKACREGWDVVEGSWLDTASYNGNMSEAFAGERGEEDAAGAC